MTSLDTFSGTFKLHDNATDVTVGYGAVYSVTHQEGCAVTIDSSTGVYHVSSVQNDNANATFKANYNGNDIYRSFTISKARPTNGTSKFVELSTTHYFFDYDSNNQVKPQTTTLNLTKHNLTGTTQWRIKRVDNAVIAEGDATALFNSGHISGADNADSINFQASLFNKLCRDNSVNAIVVEAVVPNGPEVCSDRVTLYQLLKRSRVTWDSVDDPDGNKPEDNATWGAPNGTMVGGVLAETLVSRLNNKADLDLTPPAQVTGVSANSIITDNGAAITVSWTASTAADLAGYVIAIKEGSGSYIEFMTSTNLHTFDGLKRNQAYTVKVRAYDKSSNYGGFSSEVAHTTSKDTVAPALPTSLSATASFQNIFLKWTNPADADLAGVEVYENTTNNSATATLLQTVNALPSQAGGLTRSGLASGDLRYYWLKAVDTSGNKSGFTASISATTTSVTEADFTPSASGIAPLKIVSALPTSGNYEGRVVVLTTDDKLYRYTGSQWTKALDAADITVGQLQAGRIAVGAVGASEIASGAVTTSKLAVVPVSLCPDPYFEDLADFWNNPLDAAGWVAGENPAGGVGSRYVWLGSSVGTARKHIWSKYIACPVPGTTLRLKARADNSTNQWVNVAVRFYNAADTQLTPDITLTFAAGSGTSTASVQGTVPAGATQLQFIVYNQGTSTLSGSMYVTGVNLDVAASAELIVDGAIKTQHMTAGTIDGDVIQAGTLKTDRLETTGSLPAALTVGTTGASLATIQTQASDPAARINANTTTVQPGKISISGTTTLQDWRQGNDTTKIAGGAISTNTITSNKLTVGNRNLGFIGLNFEWNPSDNYVYWSDGYIYWIDNNGNNVTQNIVAGNSGGVAAHRWFYWTPGTNYIQMTQIDGLANNDSNVFIGAWWGGSNLNINYGGTIIHGDRITTGTVNADRIVAGSITSTQLSTGQLITTSAQIGDGTIINAKIGNLEVNTLKIAGGAVTGGAGGSNANVYVPGNGTNQTITSYSFTLTDNAPMLVVANIRQNRVNVNTQLIIEMDGANWYVSTSEANIGNLHGMRFIPAGTYGAGSTVNLTLKWYGASSSVQAIEGNLAVIPFLR